VPRYDLTVIGAGIVGLATARELLRRHPGLRLAMVEKETDVGRHQSGHNSGVVHSGIYYAPGSLKARLCVSGMRDLYAFCDERGIAFEQCGKVIVASSAAELGRLEEAQRDLESALEAAAKGGLESQVLLARAHRALLLLYAWTGPLDVARKHGEDALRHAQASGQPMLQWSAHWAMAILTGVSGDEPAVARHLAESAKLAEESRSPVLPLWTAELKVQYLSSIGDWDAGLELAERAAVALEEPVEQGAPRRIRKRLEDLVVVHARILRDRTVTCQSSARAAASSSSNSPVTLASGYRSANSARCSSLASQSQRRSVRSSKLRARLRPQ